MKNLNIKINEEITLARRKNTKNWQAVIKAPDGEWRRVSTRTEDQSDATTIAFQKLAEWTVLEQRGYPIVHGRTFEYAAEKYIKHLEKMVQVGNATQSQESNIGILRNWYIPYFKKIEVANITVDKMDEFEAYRIQEMGRNPAKGTISKHNGTFRAVMEFSVQHKWCKSTDIPKLTVKGKGTKSKRRGYFTSDEFNDLMKFMVEWRDEGTKYMTRYKRDVLRLYCFFITVSGMRPGTEADNVRWKDFEHAQTDKSKKDYYRVYIKHGKKQGRPSSKDEELPATHHAVISEESYEFITPLKDKRINKVKETDYVFCSPEGEQIKGLSEMFRNCLTACSMRYGASGQKRTLYSLRHTYATWKMMRGDITYEQLKRQMNTSVEMLERHYDQATGDAFAEDLIL